MNVAQRATNRLLVLVHARQIEGPLCHELRVRDVRMQHAVKQLE
jgi:hypothetical protein